jgi:hypothetical protein
MMNLEGIFAKKSNKKGMDAGQIFIYTVSLIIVSMILIYGYKIISDFIGTSSAVEMLQFRKTVEGHIKTYTTDYGSVGYKKIPAPAGTREVCFKDYNWDATGQTNTVINCQTGSYDPNPYFIVKDSIETNEMKNMFLFGANNEFIESFYIGNATLLKKPSQSSTQNTNLCNYLCIKVVNGALDIKIIGRGDHVQIADAAWT